MGNTRILSSVFSIQFILSSIFMVIAPSVLIASDKTFIRNDKVNAVVEKFEQISSIPRCSGNERHIAKMLQQWSKSNGLKFKKDSKGNVLIKVPPTKGFEKKPTIVLQGHLDMVCEKGPDSKHNFKKDPLKLAYENDWLTAHGTTLGADNGIGIALCMALVEDKDVSHPPLELLFTVEEETGLKGAIKLKPSFIKGKILINIDSEGEGVLTIGSAGGTVTLIDLPIARNNYSMEFELFKLQVSGLRGGHSGLDINRGRANPIKIMASVLDALNQKSSIRIVNLEGGSRVNAIPENATASLAFDPTAIEDFREIVSAYQNNMRDEYASSDSGLSITLIANGEKKPKKALTQKDTQNIISLIKILPDGVFKMSTDFEGNVETSNNLGTCHIKQNNFVIMSMERSADMNKINELNSLIQSKANEVGAKAKVVDKWSAWEPNRESALLRQSKKVYNATLGRAPKIEVIHAGLECSVINAKIPKIDMIAIGPTIENAHSVNERLFIPSVEKEWAFLTALLASYGQ